MNSNRSEMPLAEAKVLSVEHVASLKEYWITTVEQLVARVTPRCVDQQQLRTRSGQDAQDAAAGGLPLGRHDGELLAEQLV